MEVKLVLLYMTLKYKYEKEERAGKQGLDSKSAQKIPYSHDQECEPSFIWGQLPRSASKGFTEGIHQVI